MELLSLTGGCRGSSKTTHVKMPLCWKSHALSHLQCCFFQLKKLQEKLKKCQVDVEATHDKYEACLNDLNGYNAKYIEDMTEVG